MFTIVFFNIQSFGQYMGIHHFLALVTFIESFVYHETIAENSRVIKSGQYFYI